MYQPSRTRTTRGRARGRAYGFRGRTAWGSDRKPSIDRPPSPPLGELLTTIKDEDLTDLSTVEDEAAAISSCSGVASFNWLDKSEPTIIVPGAPPVWTPPRDVRQLSEDSGEYFRDLNAARFPAHPMQPTVQAIFAQQPSFPSATVDLCGCGSTLGNLLRFVGHVDKPFRMLVDVVGDTVFLIRRENTPDERMQGVYGFGHTFPEAYTMWEPAVRGSTSHQRVIQYTLGGLQCVVRFEADGYYASGSAAATSAAEKEKPSTSPSSAQLTVDELSDLLGASSVNSAAAAAAEDTPIPYQPLRIVHGGHTVPRTSVFDLKTRSVRKRDAGEDTLTEELPRLWVRQIPHFVLGYHDWGRFEDIRHEDVRERVQKWERENKAQIKRLTVLVRKIVAFARARGDKGLFELRCKRADVLEVRESGPEVGSALSESWRERWVRRVEKSSQADKAESGSEAGESLEESDDVGEGVRLGWEIDEEDKIPDYTACSAERCGYCGRCSAVF